jgi:hypothetical protein
VAVRFALPRNSDQPVSRPESLSGGKRSGDVAPDAVTAAARRVACKKIKQAARVSAWSHPAAHKEGERTSRATQVGLYTPVLLSTSKFQFAQALKHPDTGSQSKGQASAVQLTSPAALCSSSAMQSNAHDTRVIAACVSRSRCHLDDPVCAWLSALQRQVRCSAGGPASTHSPPAVA